MKELLRRQRQLCFDAWAANKSPDFPKGLYKFHYECIMGAKEPEYKEPLGLSLVLIGAVVGAVIGFGVGYLIFI